MNPNMQRQNQVRQSQVQNMTPEELQRTQVLNLDDVREAVKFEKSVSKKPAIIIGIIGVLLLTFGSSFVIMDSLNKNKDNNVQQRKVADSDKDKKLHETNLNCTLTALNRADGTDGTLNIKFVFYDGNLTNYTKTYTMVPNATNPAGITTIESYKVAIQPFVTQLDGYKVVTNPKGTGVEVVTDVDLTKLDVTKVPAMNQTINETSTNYDQGVSRTELESKLTFQGYVCE